MDVLRPRQSPSHLRSHPIRSRDSIWRTPETSSQLQPLSQLLSLSPSPRRASRPLHCSLNAPTLLLALARCSARIACRRRAGPTQFVAALEAAGRRGRVAAGGGVRCGAARRARPRRACRRRGRGAGGGASSCSRIGCRRGGEGVRADAAACYTAGHFQLDAGGEKLKATGSLEASDERRVMPSFASKGTDGPFVDASVGDVAARRGSRRGGDAQDGAGQRPERAAEPAGGGRADARDGARTASAPASAATPTSTTARSRTRRRRREPAAAPGEARAAERRGAERRALGDAHAAVGDVARLLERRVRRARRRAAAGARGAAPSVTPVGARRRPAGGVAEGDGHRRRDARLPRRELRVERGGDGGDRCMLYACGDGNRRRNLAASPSPRAPTSSSPAAATPSRGGSPASSTAAPTAALPPRRRGALGCYGGGGARGGERGADGGERVRVAPESGTLVLLIRSPCRTRCWPRAASGTPSTGGSMRRSLSA